MTFSYSNISANRKSNKYQQALLRSCYIFFAGNVNKSQFVPKYIFKKLKGQLI